MRGALAGLLIFCASCTYSAPSFREVSLTWDSDGNLISKHEVRGRQPTVAAPFSSRAFSTQALELVQAGPDRWLIRMGSNADINGGEVSETLRAFPGFLQKLGWMGGTGL